MKKQFFFALSKFAFAKSKRSGLDHVGFYVFCILCLTNGIFAQNIQNFDAFDKINFDFRKSYKDARDHLLKDVNPVIMLMGDDLVLINKDQRDTQRVVRKVYHELKSVAHIPFAIYLKLVYSLELELDKNQLSDLEDYCSLIYDCKSGLSNSLLSDSQKETQVHLLDGALSFLKMVINAKKVERAQLLEYLHRSRAHFEKNIEDATRAQLLAMHEVVTNWYEGFTPEEQYNLKVLISGHKEPRVKSLTTLYFSWFLRIQGEGDVICYTEGVTEEAEMFNTIGNHLLSKKAATDIFQNPYRLHEDLLGIAAEKCLREMTFELTE